MNLVWVVGGAPSSEIRPSRATCMR